MDEAPPPDIDLVLDHALWREAKLPNGARKKDLGLDKKALKALLDRRRLMDCSAFLMNAPDTWLDQSFRQRLDETWREAMGPEDEMQKLRYLAHRVAAELMRASGIGP